MTTLLRSPVMSPAMSLAMSLTVSLAFSIAFAKERCVKSLVRVQAEGQPRVESTRLCLDDETRPGGRRDLAHLISASCLKRSCLAIEAARKAQEKARIPATYERRFESCKALGGKPEVIEFQFNGQFQPSDRCLFEKDRSFIDTMSFVGLGRFKQLRAETANRKKNQKASAGSSGVRDRKR